MAMILKLSAVKDATVTCPQCRNRLHPGQRVVIDDNGGGRCYNCAYPRQWLSAAETAQHVRRGLAAAFPSQKFSVRSSTYSGGASVDVRWTEGPTWEAVRAITGRYEGSDFDGMIDLKTSKDHWLLPDGTVSLADTHGTEGSGGFMPAAHYGPPCEGAQRVSFGADWVHCQRDSAEEAASRKAWEQRHRERIAARKMRKGA